MVLPRVLGVIPARGGSKRVPHKNIRPLHGVPLIAYTIRAAAAAERLTDWLVSTEDDQIANVALSYGATVLSRPASLAQDCTTSGAVCRHALDSMETDHGPYDMIVLLHPTSPIRDSGHIDAAIEALWQSDAPALASVACRKRTYTHNASIYAFKRDWLVDNPDQHFCEDSIPFLMDRFHSLDIDEETDFEIAELYLRHGADCS